MHKRQRWPTKSGSQKKKPQGAMKRMTTQVCNSRTHHWRTTLASPEHLPAIPINVCPLPAYKSRHKRTQNKIPSYALHSRHAAVNTPENRVLRRSPHCLRVAMLFSPECLLSVFPCPASEATEEAEKKKLPTKQTTTQQRERIAMRQHVKILTCISYEAIPCLLA